MRKMRRDRQKMVKQFIRTNIVRESGDAFAVFRLLMPQVR